MKRALVTAALVLLLFLVLRELAWRSDFMDALGRARRGHPLPALVDGCFFLVRGLLVVLGPPLSAAALAHRLTKS